MSKVIENSIINGIKIINEAIYDACTNNDSTVIVKLPYTDKKVCKGIKDYFVSEGWHISKYTEKVFVSDTEQKISSVFTLTW